MRMYNEIYRGVRLDPEKRSIDHVATDTAELRSADPSSPRREEKIDTHLRWNLQRRNYWIYTDITDSDAHSIEHCKTHAPLAYMIGIVHLIVLDREFRTFSYT